MANLITEPANSLPQTADWQAALLKLTKTTGGLCLVGLTNMDNDGAPVVMAGSRFELNGSFFECAADESIVGTPTNNAENYIYARTSLMGGGGGVLATFYYSTNTPTFSAAKGGMFRGNDRAIAKFKYVNGQYLNKSISESYGYAAVKSIDDVQIDFARITLSNINTGDAPVVMAGSRLALGGVVVSIGVDTAISGTPAADTMNYVYATLNGLMAMFSYSVSVPTYNPVKGGWYSGNNRAIARFFYTGGNYNGKMILDSYEAFARINTSQPLPTTGGIQVANTYMGSGAYRGELKGGTGGRGGSSKHNGEQNGGLGVEGQVVNRSFLLTEKFVINTVIGYDGNDGEQGRGNSGDGDTQSGGGGGAKGGNSYITIAKVLIDAYTPTTDAVVVVTTAMGGSGGGGGGADGTNDYGGGGGGGGGGYGTASDGANRNGKGGKGGSNGVGGDGGEVDMDYYPNLKGGKGGSNSAGGAGGAGGAGYNGYDSDGKIIFIAGGAGGSGAKNTSSGYARLYKLW